jgi:hypothetical protein
MQLDREAACHGNSLTWKQLLLFNSFSLEKLNRKNITQIQLRGEAAKKRSNCSKKAPQRQAA